MKDLPAAPRLLPALERVLEEIPRGERRRFASLFSAATLACLDLAEEQLPPWEGPPAQELAPTLPPIATRSAEHVEAFLSLVRDAFPSEEGSGDPPPDVAPRRSVRDATAVIRAIEGSLAYELSAWREAPVPEAMLLRLTRLAEFRGKVRAGIGEMVFLAACAFAEARREDVVPGYTADLEAAVALRRMVALLAGVVHAENERLRSLVGPSLREAVARVGAELGAFARTPTHGSLRAQDRAAFLEARARIESLLAGSASDDDLLQVVEGLDRFLESLAVISRREILIVHDREVLSAAAAHLEGARAASSPEAARVELASAHRLAQRLFGKDVELDAFLRSMWQLDPGALDAAGIAAEVETLATRLTLARHG